MAPRPAAGLALLLLLLGTALARELSTAPSVTHRQLLGDKDHKYKPNDRVPLWASKVGPFANPTWRSEPPRRASPPSLLRPR
jgi:hypothetical protein